MPTASELNDELLIAKKSLNRAQMLIHQQRAQLDKAKNTRLAVVSGTYVEEVDPIAEIEKVQSFMGEPDDNFSRLVATLKFYADPECYVDGMRAMVLEDSGRRARAALETIE